MTSPETAVRLNNQHEIVRQLADFPEDIWVDRIASFTPDKQFEKERGTGTSVECYMKDYTASEEKAMEKFEEIIENAWKDVNEECLISTTIPRKILKVIMNLARICEVVYKNRGDGLTDQRRMENYIMAMIVDSASV